VLWTALLTAIYMTRLMLLTFSGASRTGEAEQSALHEAPAIMTAPVLVLAGLALVAGWLNLPELIPLGRVGALAEWLEPVTGASSRVLAGSSHVSIQSEQMLIAVAVALALIGIGFAAIRYRGATADKAHAEPDTGLAGVLASAYGVDAAIDASLVRPFNAFARTVVMNGLDRGVDRVFSVGGSLLSRTAALVGVQLQDGDVGKYAWLLAAGAVAVLAALTLA
jgi:NADH-quinone oxidoreductase subunit L